MSRTFIRQDDQIQSSDLYDDTIAPTLGAYETNPANIETDLNTLRSQTQNFLNRDGISFPTGNWHDDIAAPSALETGVPRGINSVNAGLHAVEKKRVLREVHNLTGITVGGSDDFVILGTGELPSQTTAALGSVTTLGTVVAPHGGTFGTHTLSEVLGTNAVSPLNLCLIVDGATRDPILSDGRIVYGLLQGEVGLTDGATITDTTNTRVQLSFVRISAAGNDLEATPAADIQGLTIQYCTRERVRLEDLNEQDFLTGAIVDVGAGAGTIDRQTGYTNQGITPVDLVTNATLDLEGPGLSWIIRDDLEATLFEVIEGSAGGTSQINIGSDVDELDIDAAVNDFAEGVTVDSTGTAINVGVTAGRIDAAASLTVESTGGTSDLFVRAGQELYLDDGNQPVSWTQTEGVKLSETDTEWADFETAFGGEVSILNAIVQAKSSAARTKSVAVVTTNVAADVNVTGTGGGLNLDANLSDYSTVTFVTDVDVFLNGVLMRNGVDATTNHDVYPGDVPVNGDLKFEFKLKGTGSRPDVITMIVYG